MERDGVRAALPHHRAARLAQLLLVGPMADGLVELAAVGFEDMDAAVFGEGLELGVGNHRYVVCFGQVDDLARRCKSALVVVFDDEGVRRADVMGNAAGNLQSHLGRRGELEIHA